MDAATFKRNLPTFTGMWERRQKAAQNRLPAHLRPPSKWPIVVRLGINLAIIFTLLDLMSNIDDVTTDAVPAIIMIACLIFLLYSVISGLKMRALYRHIDGHRLAQLNFWVMLVALILWPATVAFFLR